MKESARRLVLAISVAGILMLAGCERPTTPEPGSRTGEATSTVGNPLEQAADTVTGTARTSIDRAKGTESAIGQAAQHTAEQVQRTGE